MKIKQFLYLGMIFISIAITFSVIIQLKLINLNQFDSFSSKIQSIIQNYELENEGDVYCYSAFTFDNFYPCETGIYQRNVFKLTGTRKHDLHSIIRSSLLNLNLNSLYKYNLADFTIGFTRSDPINGYQYNLFFKNNLTCCDAIQIQRPFASLKFKGPFIKKKIKINIILPFSTNDNNYAKLKRFLKIYNDVALKKDFTENALFLIIGSKNEKQLKKFTDLIDQFNNNFNFKSIKLSVIKKKEFSRSELLEFGAKNIKSNELMFFCDIDIIFKETFLEMCRSNTLEGEQVFYPILFSYYNPVLLEQMQNLESAQKNLTIDINSGFFRKTGFGMVCVYKKDFDQIGRFKDWKTKGWGGEDLFLYRKFIKSGLKIFRAISPDLLHIYHSKSCDKTFLDNQQSNNCFNAQILNEASQKTLGMFYFKYYKNLTNKRLKK